MEGSVDHRRFPHLRPFRRRVSIFGLKRSSALFVPSVIDSQLMDPPASQSRFMKSSGANVEEETRMNFSVICVVFFMNAIIVSATV
jgi:hypothetical protein